MADTVERLERSHFAPWLRVRPPGLAKRTIRVRPPAESQAAAMRMIGMAIRCALMPVEVQRRS